MKSTQVKGGGRLMTPTEKETAEHYGYTHTANSSGCWLIDEGTLDRLRTLPDVLDPKKKIKVTFDYDPDFPRALLQVWEGLRLPDTDSLPDVPANT